jgi:hypothetical protein
VEATSGASRAAPGNAETLALNGAGEERRGKIRHSSRGRSGQHTIPGGMYYAQEVVDVSDVDRERNISAL